MVFISSFLDILIAKVRTCSCARLKSSILRHRTSELLCSEGNGLFSARAKAFSYNIARYVKTNMIYKASRLNIKEFRSSEKILIYLKCHMNIPSSPSPKFALSDSVQLPHKDSEKLTVSQMNEVSTRIIPN